MIETPEHKHIPVMLDAALEGLALRSDGIYVDATLGRGGHAAAILETLGPRGRLIALDRDPEAIRVGHARFATDPRVQVLHSPFSRLSNVLSELGVKQVDGILADLGVSSPQLDAPQRGFSFRHDGPLDMRMDPENGESAADWLAAASAEDIARVLRDYGEERFAMRIARAIVAARQEAPLIRTRELAALVAKTLPFREVGKDPATRTFQAVRIFINRELDELTSFLSQTLSVLAPQGRLVVISFHSLEDRVVKRFMRDHSRVDTGHPDLPIRAKTLPEAPLRLIGKAHQAEAHELARNPRARSAVLRVAERSGAGAVS